jgi:hypothetical protein
MIPPRSRLAVVTVVLTIGAPAALAQRPAFAPQWPDARAVSFLSPTTAVLNYRTAAPQPTKIQLRTGTLPASTPGQEKAWSDAKVVEGDNRPTLVHCVTLTGLKPATRYYYRVHDPDYKSNWPDHPEAWSVEKPWSREYALATLAEPGSTSFVRIPVKVLIIPNVVNLSTVAPDAPQPAPMAPEEIELDKNCVRQDLLFQWVNSRMRYWMDCEFFEEPEWQRLGDERADLPDFYKKWKPGRDLLRVFDPGDIGNHEAKPPLKDQRIWTGQVVISCERRWDKDKKRWFYQGSGGGTFGIDWMLWGDETQRPAPGRSEWLGGSDQAWLMCHEFHHQTESQYGLSGLEGEFDRMVFDHFAAKFRSPNDTWGSDTAFNHGEHWDGIAWEMRMFTDVQYFRNIFGEIVTAKDTDGDGIPDDDSRLPLDEKRLGSDATKAATDGVTSDMDKVLMAKWVPTTNSDLRDKVYNPGYVPLWQLASGKKLPVEAGAAGYAWPKLRETDSDGDGVPDKDDPYPIYPWEPKIGEAQIKADGDLSDWADVKPIGHVKAAGVECTVKTAHDDKNLYYAVEITGPYRSVMFNIDADADGWYVGNDNYQIVVGQPAKENDPEAGKSPPRDAELDQSGKPVLRQAVGHICSNRGWPYFDEGAPVKWTDPKNKREYEWQRPKMFGDYKDIVCATSVSGDKKVIEIAMPNGSGKSPIQAGPGHPIGLAFYIRLVSGGQLALYEPYTLFTMKWE